MLLADRFSLAATTEAASNAWLELSLDGQPPVRVGPFTLPALRSGELAERLPPPQSDEEPSVYWGSSLVLERARLWPETPKRVGDLIGPRLDEPGLAGYRGELYWRRAVEGALATTAIVQLLDAQNHVWARSDVPLVLDPGSDRLWTGYRLGPWGQLPPGRYRVALTLETPDKQPLGISGPARFGGSTFEITTFRVGLDCDCVPPSASAVGVDFQDGLRLVGYQRQVGGDAVDVALYWQVRERAHHNYTAFVHVLGPDGKLVAQFDRRSYDDTLPTDAWEIGQIVPWFARLPLPPGGPFQLVAGLYDDPTAGPLRRLDDRDTVTLGLVDREGPPPMAKAIEFEIGARLLGGRLRREGGRLLVTLYWKADRPILDPYTVFVHVTGQDGRVVAQGDGAPELGLRTTRDWPRGESIVDPHGVDLSQAPSALKVVVGLYSPSTNARARTVDGRDAVDLGPVPGP
jgi:hypothetical protein